MSVLMSEAAPAYRYHLLRGALEGFSKNLAELDKRQLAEVRRRADKTYDLESLVLASAEASEVIIPPEQVDAAFSTVLSRYPDQSALEADLRANGLSEELLRQALHRELYEETGLRPTEVRLLGVESAHSTGHAPDGRLEDYHAIRVLYTGRVGDGAEPVVQEVGGSTDAAAWVPLGELDHRPLTEVVRAALDRTG